MRRLFTAVAAIAAIMLVLSFGTIAQAGTIIDTAVAHLRNDPVYVDPGASSVLSPSAASNIKSHITSGSVAIFVAALPSNVTDEVGGNADNLPKALGQALGRSGAVAVVTSKSFRAGASSGTGLGTGQGAQLATLAFAAHKSQGPEAVIQDWISRVQAQVAANHKVSGSSASTRTATTKKKSSNAGVIVAIILIALFLTAVAITAVVVLVHRNRRKKEFRAEYRSTSSQVEHLGGQVLQYADVTDEDLATASERHQWASSELHTATSVADLESVNEAVEQGFAAIRHYQHKNDPQPSNESIRTAARYADTATGSDAVGSETLRHLNNQPVSRPAPSNTTVVNNYNGSGQQGYWYGGGYYGGSYYGPGYYSSMNFWEGMMLGEMLSDHDRYDRGYDHDGDDRQPAAVAVGDSGGGGDWESTSDSGGGDWGSSGGDSTPSYDPPSYDPPDTGSSGGDWGGSSDSGGGSFDFGGGGGDSGGGGGDW